jgi:hypothetical protein
MIVPSRKNFLIQRQVLVKKFSPRLLSKLSAEFEGLKVLAIQPALTSR